MNKTTKLTEAHLALLQSLQNGADFARWTARNEKHFLNHGVSIFPLPLIKGAIKRGLVTIEAGKGLNKGFDFLAITDAGRQALAMPDEADAARDAKRIVVEGNKIYMVGTPDVYARIVLRDGLLIDTALVASELDDMIALLTAAKTELARRANGSVE